MRCALAIALLALAPGARSAGQSRTHPPFMIGLLESDGVLTPLARFERDTWTTPWPWVPTELSSLADIPEQWWPGFSRARWRVALAGGPRALRITRAGQTAVDCGAVGAALMTDYRDGGGNREVQRVGIAAAGVVKVHAVAIFDSTSPRWGDVERRFRSELRRIKRSALGMDLRIGARIPAPNGEVWMFEGRSADYQIRLWSGRSAGHEIHVVKQEMIGPDPLISPITIGPIGAIWGLEHLALLVAEQGWEGGNYAVLSITPGEVLTLVGAGSFGC